MLVKNDQTDQLFFNEYKDNSENLQKIIKDGLERHFAYEDLTEDVYSMMFRGNPEFDESPCPAGLQIAKSALEQISQLQEYKDLRAMTRFDPLASGMATQAMGKKLTNMLPPVGKKDPNQILAEIDELKALSQQSPKLEKKFKGKITELEDQLNKVNEASQKADSRQVDPDAMRQAMRQIVQEAVDETSAGMDAANAFAGQEDQGSGSPRPVNLAEKMAMAKHVNKSKKLQKIAEMAGRFTRIARKKQQEKAVATEVSSIQQGDNISRLLSSELITLRHPKLKYIFYKNLFERKLLEYKIDGKEPQGKGPVICCIDSSGSMAGAREIASKGIALALLDIARKQHRDFALIQFSGSKREMTCLEVKKGQITTLKLLAELEMFIGGGTEFESPLKKSMDLISTSDYKQADIIFITDGEAYINKDFLESYHKLKEEKQFSCIGILIGNETTTVEQFADEQFKTHDLLNDADEANQDAQDRMFKI